MNRQAVNACFAATDARFRQATNDHSAAEYFWVLSLESLLRYLKE